MFSYEVSRYRHQNLWAADRPNAMGADVLKFPSHFSDIQQVLSDQTMTISCGIKQFFIGKSDSFQ